MFLKSMVASALALGMTTTATLAADWQPRKPVEFIIMAGTGGGADQIARLLQGLIEQTCGPFVLLSGLDAHLMNPPSAARMDRLSGGTRNNFLFCA